MNIPAPTNIQPMISPGSNASFKIRMAIIIPIRGVKKKKTDTLDELCLAIRYCQDIKQKTLMTMLWKISANQASG